MNSADPPRLRAFLAVEVAAPIHAALVELKNELARIASAVRWVRDGGLHATIRFLGHVAPAQLEAILHTLTPPLRSFPAFSMRVRGLGVFPTLRRPRVIWVGLDGPELPQLARVVDQAIVPLGFPAETRPFQAHLTLGRVQGPRGWSRLEEALKGHWIDDFGSCWITELIAYRSDLRPDGAVYTKLWTIPFEESRRGVPDGPGQ